MESGYLDRRICVNRWAMADVVERTASDRLRANERFKSSSGVLANLGSALLAAAFGRWFVVGFDAFVFQWLVAATTAMAVGIRLLSFLEAQDANG
jgi:uncharacterized membrane protein